ncbi:MAG: polysulfide reductase NrfD [Nitrospinae bacterium]|nr:polysulfide reductase NrfD [Nitrospinota bacterium]
MPIPMDEKDNCGKLPSFEELRELAARKNIQAGADIDLNMPEGWLNQYSLSPMFFTTRAYFIFTIAAGMVVAWAIALWGYQIVKGMGVTGLRHPIFWGIYIASFVFWVGLSHSGTIVSSLLRLTRAHWRRPILRGAEAMTVFALMVAALFPLIHMGRVWRAYYMFPLFSQRELWPNFKSPLVWDMMAISVYLVSSVTFLYVGLLPDIALARDMCPQFDWRKKYLTVLALGWRGSHRQWMAHERASTLLAVFILLIAPSVHTIVSWDFAMSITPGWHTTIFGPYFVVGAIYSGVAGVIALMILFRWIFKLDEIIRLVHIRNLAKLELAMAIIWSYFYFVEFITTWYGHKPAEWRIWEYQWERFPHLMVIMLGGTAVAIAALSFNRVRNSPLWLFIITMLINVGMYIERYLILVPVLTHRDNPYMWTDYLPSIVEKSIVAGSFAFFFLLYAVFSKLLPVVTVADIREGKFISGDLRIGNTYVRVHADAEEQS